MDDTAISLSDQDLLSRLKNFEDSFVERKTGGDSKDWLKSVVAFANSTPIGYPAVLFIGVRNDGTPEGTDNLDKLQQTFSSRLQAAYPPIYSVTKILEAEGKQFLGVIVPGSEDRPHFAGQAYVRNGSRTEIASESQFASLLTSRQSKSREILKWVGKQVSVDWMRVDHVHAMGPVSNQEQFIIVDCNTFYMTVRRQSGPTQSIPLKRVELSFDSERNQLKFEIYPV